MQNGVFTRIIVRVKTTVELDEQKLLRVMQLTGLKTRKEAIDYALSQAERAAKIAKLFARPRRSKEELRNLLDPNYDLMTLREQEKPKLDRRGTVLPLSDLVIACCAFAVDTAVITTDPHFSQIAGLKVKKSLF